MNMRHNKIYFLLLFILLFISVTSCKTDDDVTVTQDSVAAPSVTEEMIITVTPTPTVVPAISHMEFRETGLVYDEENFTITGEYNDVTYNMQIISNTNQVGVYRVVTNFDECRYSAEYVQSNNDSWIGVLDNISLWYNGGHYGDGGLLNVRNSIAAEVTDSFTFVSSNEDECLYDVLTILADNNLCSYSTYIQYPYDEERTDEMDTITLDGYEAVEISFPITKYVIREEYNHVPLFVNDYYINSVRWSGDIQGYLTTRPTLIVDIFDGSNLVSLNVLNNWEITETIEDSLPVLPLTDCIDSIHSQLRLARRNFAGSRMSDTTIVGAELAYVFINELPPDDIFQETTESYMVPIWVVYYSTGNDSGDVVRSAIYLNAITGDGLFVI